MKTEKRGWQKMWVCGEGQSPMHSGIESLCPLSSCKSRHIGRWTVVGGWRLTAG